MLREGREAAGWGWLSSHLQVHRINLIPPTELLPTPRPAVTKSSLADSNVTGFDGVGAGRETQPGRGSGGEAVGERQWGRSSGEEAWSPYSWWRRSVLPFLSHLLFSLQSLVPSPPKSHIIIVRFNHHALLCLTAIHVPSACSQCLSFSRWGPGTNSSPTTWPAHVSPRKCQPGRGWPM